jgi:hypothetical protein
MGLLPGINLAAEPMPDSARSATKRKASGPDERQQRTSDSGMPPQLAAPAGRADVSRHDNDDSRQEPEDRAVAVHAGLFSPARVNA